MSGGKRVGLISTRDLFALCDSSGFSVFKAFNTENTEEAQSAQRLQPGRN